MTFSDEIVMAYVDGELDVATRTALEAALAQDAELAARIARHRGLRRRLSAALDPVLDEPVPARLRDAASRPAAPPGHDVLALRRARAAAPRWSWPQWGALAAALVVGVLLRPLLPLSSGADLYTRAGRLLAGGSLARGLSQQLAGSQTADAAVQIGVSFRATAGGYCRTFVLRDQGALAGLACREHGRWQLQALAAIPPAPRGDYRPAAAALPPAVTHAVDELMSGEPLDAAQERSARDAGWNR